MMNRRQLLRSGSAALGLMIAGVPAHAIAQSRRGTINALVQPEPSSLMIALALNGPTQLISGNIYEGLLRYDEKLQPHPELAESWTISADAKTYTFKLRPNVKWHDGKPFSSADALFSIDVFLRKVHPRARANLMQVESITAPDPLTIEFKLKQPFGPFMDIFEVGSMPMVPKHIYEGTDFATTPMNNTPIGTGPLKFKEWSKGSYILLVANEDYYVPGIPAVEKVYFHVIPDAATRATAFESGQIDLVHGGGVEYIDIERLSKLPGAAVTTKGWEFFSPLSWIWINNRKAPMDNVKLRQAVSYAIDRKAMSKIAWFGYANVAKGPFNSDIAYADPSLQPFERDLGKAKRLLAESGYKGETLRIHPVAYGELWTRQAEMVRQNLTAAGFKVEIVADDVAGFNKRMEEWDFDLAFTYLYQYGHPALGVARNYVSSSIAKGSAYNNVEGYVNKKVDELFAAAAIEPDVEKAQALYYEVQKILIEDMPVAWLHELTFPTLYRTKIKDPISSGIGLNDSIGRASLA